MMRAVHTVSACLLFLLSSASAANCPTNGPPSNAQWRFTTSFPPGCSGTACSYFLGVRTNEDPLFLDFMMEGNARGWIAVGYTPNQAMPDADVFVCALIGGQVTILDTYNIPNGRSNMVDTSQDLCPSSMNFVNGRIQCVFSRAIKTNDVLQDKALNQSYYQLSGWTDATGSSMAAIAYHSPTAPKISVSTLNPTNASSPVTAEVKIDPLIRAHGILMIVAWPVLGVMGIFFAAWMKPALPKAEWFQVHRAAMLVSLFLGCVAFLLIFVAKMDTRGLVSFMDPTTTAHFAIGIIVMALHVLNPIISAFRCTPAHPRRWIFNLVHGTCVGLGVELLALVNVGIGLAIFGNKLSLATVAPPLAVYLAYVAFLVILIGALFIIYTVIAIKTNSPPLAPSVLKPLLALITPSSPDPTKTEVVVDLTDKAKDPPTGGVDTPPKPPSKDAPLSNHPNSSSLVMMAEHYSPFHTHVPVMVL
ncbi:hypothetical protein EMCRGX_G017474 [Ephydatia muelleri]